MARRVLLVVGLSFVLAPSVSVRAELPPLIPRKVLFGNPVRGAPRLSPDGKRLSYLCPTIRMCYRSGCNQ